MNKIHSMQSNQIGTIEQIETTLNALKDILSKCDQVFQKNPSFLTDLVPKITSAVLMSKFFIKFL